MALAPLSVHQNYQGKGIGKQLVTCGLKKAKDLGYKSVIVLGHENYYSKFGFLPAINWNIQSPFNVPNNVFKAIELVPDGLKNVSGIVTYPKIFYEC